MKRFFEKYPVLIDPSLCWDFFWKLGIWSSNFNWGSCASWGSVSDTPVFPSFTTPGLPPVATNRRHCFTPLEAGTFAVDCSLEVGWMGTCHLKNGPFQKERQMSSFTSLFQQRCWVFFGRLCHWPIECNFCWNQQCTSEITCEHFWDWLDDKHGCPVSRTTQRFAEPCSWAYCNGLGQMVEDDKKKTLSECIIQRLTSWPWKNIATDPLIYSHLRCIDTS